jgi:5-methylthioadenosine/S-adenosylhomocysteine deaminase
MPANLVWHLATVGGAQAMGIEQLGCVKPGWKADFMLVKPTLPTPLSVHNIYEQLLLYCNASHVDTVFAAGKVKKVNGMVPDADIETLRARSQQAAARLWQKVA